MDTRERALNLRRRLNEHALDIEPLAQEAADIFAAAGRGVHRDWLGLELQGYGSAVDRAPLGEVLRAHELGPHEGARLVAHVSAYRAQQGTTVEPSPRPFHHFFVESIHDLSDAARRFRATGAQTVQLGFSPDVPNYPAAGIFPGDVFDRVLLGFRATLHLQLGSIVA
jgi:hypothetical protein